MSIFAFELPTTGSLSFADYFDNGPYSYTARLSEATQARANLRALLKESKHVDGDKDYLRLVKTLEEYLPYLYSIINCVASGDLIQKSEPVFSWRTTLSAHIFSASPRLSLPSLPAELTFSLHTLAFALSNLARHTVSALGSYEHERGLSEAERVAKDERLAFAVSLLCRASGLWAHVGEGVLADAERNEKWMQGVERPPEVRKDVALALSKLALSAAQALAIRKLLTKSAYDTTVSPGPPLPKSHPSPALLAKLHLEAAALCGSAHALLTPSSSAQSEVIQPLRQFSAGGAAVHLALAHKWLGVAASGGEAVGYLTWAKSELEDQKDGGGRKSGGKDEGKEGRKGRRDRVLEELNSVTEFLRHYKKLNDTLSFQPVPSQAELQARVPAGRMAVAIKPFEKPAPAFGPGSVEYVRRQVEEIVVRDESEGPSGHGAGSYAGAGSYF
ncbi:hypothetical protein FA95DRAFT_1525170 [Auriscalpium vulgare]|uniref:Uncharacterized protein n=1 Tax=Auriscalpium vulgare TaxID=40419 RepID=A0ACB8RGD2_9AGAM|nr:hypothetical protein FA95DRAFT_1525170 [Auriscalpium vulgare]